MCFEKRKALHTIKYMDKARDLSSYDWREDAACNGAVTEIFYPEKGESHREAKEMCLGCRVVERCLEEALDNNEKFGIWGNMSPKQRTFYKKRRQQNAR